MTPVDWELSQLGLEFGDGIHLGFPDEHGDCLLDVDQEYTYNLPFAALKRFVERVENRSTKQAGVTDGN